MELANQFTSTIVDLAHARFIEANNRSIHISFTYQIAGPDGKGEVKNIVHGVFPESWLMHWHDSGKIFLSQQC